jgi:hypothetical protein
MRIPLHSQLFLFSALAFPSIPSKSLKFRLAVFSICTALEGVRFGPSMNWEARLLTKSPLLEEPECLAAARHSLACILRRAFGANKRSVDMMDTAEVGCSGARKESEYFSSCPCWRTLGPVRMDRTS